jgi:hypothetical protein
VSKYKLKVNIVSEPKRDFWIMNKDAMYFAGLKSDGPIWTDKVSDARVFNEPDKIVSLRRWKPQDNPEIVYIDGK